MFYGPESKACLKYSRMGFLLSLFSLVMFNDCGQMPEIRNQYHSIQSKSELNAFIDQVEKTDCRLCEPYRASAIMQKAKYAFLPTSKLSYFKKGKNRLEEYIQLHPESVEARYVRVLVQSEIPSFLGYNGEMKSDIQFIQSHIGKSGLPEDYQQLILKNVQSIKNK